jgi:hypothetical protein
MKLSTLAVLLWALGFLATAVLLGVLVWRGRWRQFPFFTGWIAFQAALTVALFTIYLLRGFGNLYGRIYWIGVWPDFALQFGVVIEMARIVLRPTGTWVRDARSHFITAGIGGVAVAAILSWWITPPVHGAAAAWELRGDLFTSLVICELFVAMSVTANRLGLGWRSHVMAEGQGLTAWNAVTVMVTALQSYFGTHYFVSLGRIGNLAYMAATLWIAIRLWVPEPERLPISEDLQKYILALHRRVEYDLRRLDAGR